MMYEKILQKLKSQRGSNNQVTDKTLEVKAKSLEPLITTDEILATVDFTEEIKSMQGNIGFVAAEAVKNIQTEAQKEAAKKAQEEELRVAEEKRLKELKDNPNADIASIIAEAVKAAVDPLMEDLSALKGEKITTSRSTELDNILKDAPKAFKDQVLSNFSQMQFADDTAFDSFKETTKTNFESFKQLASEQGISFPTPTSEVKKESKPVLNPAFQAAFEAKAEADKQASNQKTN